MSMIQDYINLIQNGSICLELREPVPENTAVIRFDSDGLAQPLSVLTDDETRNINQRIKTGDIIRCPLVNPRTGNPALLLIEKDHFNRSRELTVAISEACFSGDDRDRNNIFYYPAVGSILTGVIDCVCCDLTEEEAESWQEEILDAPNRAREALLKLAELQEKELLDYASNADELILA